MIRVQEGDFDVGKELAELRTGNTAIGGIALFVGTVRGAADGKAVGTMTLEHYPAMTARELERIEAEAQRRWALEETLIIHRVGRLEPGEQIVLVITSSAHRQAAFDACEFLMDWLKTKAPFWKREEFPEGERWVEARTSDDAAAARWSRED